MMRWEEVCEDRLLQDLPFKIELNKWGQITFGNRQGKLLQSLLVPNFPNQIKR